MNEKLQKFNVYVIGFGPYEEKILIIVQMTPQVFIETHNWPNTGQFLDIKVSLKMA